jgi:hypothetical protein
MARDNDKAVRQLKDKAIDLELKKFMGQIVGQKPKKKTWIRHTH